MVLVLPLAAAIFVA